MSVAFSSAQLAALLQDESQARLLLDFAAHQFCTGNTDFTYGGTDYEARPMDFEDIEHGSLGINVSVAVADPEQQLEDENYSARFAGQGMTWILLLRGPDRDWAEIWSVSWYIRYTQVADGMVRFNLFGNTGFKRRAGLSVFGRNCELKFGGVLCGYDTGVGPFKSCNGTYESCQERERETQFRGFRYALEAGHVLDLGTGELTVQPPYGPTGGGDPPYVPDPWTYEPVSPPPRRIEGGDPRVSPNRPDTPEPVSGGTREGGGRVTPTSPVPGGDGIPARPGRGGGVRRRGNP